MFIKTKVWVRKEIVNCRNVNTASLNAVLRKVSLKNRRKCIKEYDNFSSLIVFTYFITFERRAELKGC